MSTTRGVVVGECPSPTTSTQSKLTCSSVLETVKEHGTDKKCIFCNHCTIDELNLGPLYARDGVICHYYCLLFCSKLHQNGSKDTDGILGFLTKDIVSEVMRVKSKTSKNYKFYHCRFCNKPGATIGCYLTKCRMVYHFPCGLQNGVNFKFTSKFESYCKAHSGPKIFKPVILRRCPICAESLEGCTTPTVLGQCCSNSNFHKECIQSFALSAGSHHLKCPTCADKDRFIPDVKSQGIFVPEKDADWEIERAFQDQQEKYSRCDAQKCFFPGGRNHNETGIESIWRILRCSSCAGSAIHFKCAYSVKANLSVGSVAQNWLCDICSEVERRFEDDKENRSTNPPSAMRPDSEDMDEIETPVNARAYDKDYLSNSDDNSSQSVSSDESLFSICVVRKNKTNDKNQITDDNSSLLSVSSDESIFSACVKRRKIIREKCQRDEEGIDDSGSGSSGGTLFSVVKKQSSYLNNQHGMDLSESRSEIEESTSSMTYLKGIRNELDEDNEGSQSPIAVLSLPGNDLDDDARSDFSENNTSSSSSDISLFIPVEPLRKRIRVLDEFILPAFKISNGYSDDNNFKEIRCYCKRYNDDERLTECRRCGISLHQRCQAGMFVKHGKSLQTRCCQRCTDSPVLKELQEIPMAGNCILKGCENTRSKIYYLTLVSRDGLMVRRHDAVYITEGESQDLESSRILRVEKLWKNTKGTRYISGHFYYRPSETVNAATRRFYRQEIFRSLTPTKTEIKMENVLGRCWILDPITYSLGRPSCTTLEDEKDIFICESWVDPQTKRISFMELAHSLHSICMKPDAFKEFTEKMKIRRDYRLEGVKTSKQGCSSSVGPTSQGRPRENQISLHVVSSDDSIVVLDLD